MHDHGRNSRPQPALPPGWCPIKPVPEKRHRTDILSTLTAMERIYEAGYNEGYDKCMDDILGGYGDGKKETPDEKGGK